MAISSVQYVYDPLDRLVSSVLAGEPLLQRFYQRQRLATEIQGDVTRCVFQSADQLLAQGDNTSTHLLITDLQRSVLGADQETRQGYSPYGQRTTHRGLSTLLGFNGERPDPTSGRYLLGNGYRAYNPVLMRFNSPDSLSPFGLGGINAYAYCLGDPINRLDPTGHIPFFNSFMRRVRAVFRRTPDIQPATTNRNPLANANSGYYHQRQRWAPSEGRLPTYASIHSDPVLENSSTRFIYSSVPERPPTYVNRPVSPGELPPTYEFTVASPETQYVMDQPSPRSSPRNSQTMRSSSVRLSRRSSEIEALQRMFHEVEATELRLRAPQLARGAQMANALIRR